MIDLSSCHRSDQLEGQKRISVLSLSTSFMFSIYGGVPSAFKSLKYLGTPRSLLTYGLWIAGADFQCFILFGTFSSAALVASLATVRTVLPHLARWAWQGHFSR